MSRNEHQANYEKSKNIAKRVNLINFLNDRYPEHIVFNASHKRYEHPEHDSLVINPKAFYWFSKDTGGDTIRFLQDILGKDYNTAVSELCDYAGENPQNVPTAQRTNNEAKIPDMTLSETCRENVFRYLTEQRHLDPDIIKMLMRMGDIYADDRNNAVFVNNELTIAFLRGTVSSGNKPNTFRQIIAKKNNEYIIFMPRHDDIKKVYITESPIDSISLYQIMSEDKKCNSVFVSMLGLKRETVNRIAWDFAGAEIVIACDWDGKGNEFYENNYKNKYKRMIAPPQYRESAKDWNALLIEIERSKTE